MNQADPGLWIYILVAGIVAISWIFDFLTKRDALEDIPMEEQVSDVGPTSPPRPSRPDSHSSEDSAKERAARAAARNLPSHRSGEQERTQEWQQKQAQAQERARQVESQSKVTLSELKYQAKKLKDQELRDKKAREKKAAAAQSREEKQLKKAPREDLTGAVDSPIYQREFPKAQEIRRSAAQIFYMKELLDKPLSLRSRS